MADQEVIRDLLVALGAKVDPKTNKEIGDFDQRLKALKARMQDVAAYVPKFAQALAGMFSPQLIADARELNKLLAAQPGHVAQVTKAATDASRANQDAAAARKAAREAKAAERQAIRDAAKAAREEAKQAREAARAEKQAASETKARAAALAEAAAKAKEQAQELARWALTGAKALVGMFAAAVTGATAAAVTTGQHAEQVIRQAQALNLTRAELQEYQHVFETFGADASEINDAFVQITEKTADLVAGNKSVADEFALIGIRAADLKNKRPGEIFEIVSQAIATTTDRQKALAAASKLFGEDTAKKLLPAMVRGKAGIQALRKEAHQLGVVLDDEALASGAALAQQWRTLKSTATGLKNELGVALAPVINRLLGGLLAWVKTNRELISQRVEWFARTLERALVQLDKTVRRFGGWDAVFLQVAQGAGLLTLIANLDKVEKLLGAIRMATTAAGTAFSGAAAAAGLPAEALALVLAAILVTALELYVAFDDLYTFFTGGKSVIGTYLDTLTELFPALGNLRDLASAVGAYLRALLGVFWAVATGATSGLSPALKAVSDAFQPVREAISSVIDLVERLIAKWNELRALPFLGDLAKRINVAAYELGGQAPGIQAQVQGAVAGQVGQAIGQSTTNNTTNRSVVVNSNATIHGGSPLDYMREQAGAMRAAHAAFAGGER